MLLTQEYLKSIVSYDPITGAFTRTKTLAHNAQAGALCGCPSPNGYLYFRIKKKLYLNHRLAFLYMEGKFPDKEVDHRDGDRLNNAWANLRHASSLQNKFNQKKKGRISGYKGIGKMYKSSTFRASITKNGKRIHIGTYKTEIEAARAYDEAARRIYGEFAKTNF